MTDLFNPFFTKALTASVCKSDKIDKKKTVVSCDVKGGITLGTKLKMPILTFYLPHNLQIRILYFRSLCIRDTVSNKTYQNFREKRLVRPGSKYPI